MSTILLENPKPIKINTKEINKVKLIAKIRGGKKSLEETNWISINNNFVSFKDHSNTDGYEVDSCYGPNEDNFAIYSREIKPLLPSVYDGQSLTIIGFGAKGSGKTYTIQGNEKEQGLAALATNEILSGANENGISVSISLFEVFNEHIYDLLDSKHSEIQVLEDAKGKIKLKGISEAVLESISEFHKLTSHGYNTNRRSHRGLIIKFSSKSVISSSKTVGKMTFVDLAGYEDARRKSCEGVDLIENSRINKSIYSLLNVVHATNASESRVPFRDSKLTRMLQESFGLKNRVLLINCLNSFPCQDTVFTLQLASRSCQGVNRMSVTSSIQKSKFSGKSTVSSTLKGKLNVGSSAKKQASSTPSFTVRNKSRIAKERKVEDKGKDATASNQLKPPSVSTMQSRYLSEINSEISLSLPEEEESMSKDCVVTIAKNEVAHFLQEDSMSKSCVVKTARDEVTHFLQEDSMSKNCVVTTVKDEVAHFIQEDLMSKDCVVTTVKDEDTFAFNIFEDTKPKEEMVAEHKNIESHNLEVTPIVDGNTKALILFGQGANKEKENNNICINGEGSPPLSSRLRELSNNLRNLYNSTPIQIKLKPEIDSSCGRNLPLNIMDPKTPVQNKMDVDRFNSPWEKYNTRSTGLKQSLADEYLNFLNSASKEELKALRGIGEKRATYILQLREESPEPFKSLEDLKGIGLSEKQVKGMMKKIAGDLFN